MSWWVQHWMGVAVRVHTVVVTNDYNKMFGCGDFDVVLNSLMWFGCEMFKTSIIYLSNLCCFRVLCFMFVLSCGNSSEDYFVFFWGVSIVQKCIRCLISLVVIPATTSLRSWTSVCHSVIAWPFISLIYLAYPRLVSQTNKLVRLSGFPEEKYDTLEYSKVKCYSGDSVRL